jgi:hypothetical protein
VCQSAIDKYLEKVHDDVMTDERVEFLHSIEHLKRSLVNDGPTEGSGSSGAEAEVVTG